jgi:hypothetical protein
MPREKSFPQGVWGFTRGSFLLIKGPIESTGFLMISHIRDGSVMFSRYCRREQSGTNPMKITIDFSEARDVPCERCGWLDGLGGVQIVDDQQVSKVFCHQCTIDLVRLCLPNGRFLSNETTSAPMPVALAS